ncbi:hypothetical protein Q9Q99_08520 [Curtobacterium flaccumfaciens]|nr:hypothetical protein Q9Q99_08520 [Curtobacterium flaccumfaciens]
MATEPQPHQFEHAVLQHPALPDELGQELRVPDGVPAERRQERELFALVVLTERDAQDVPDVDGVDVGVHELPQGAEHHVGGPLHDLPEQVFLRREVRVDRTLAEPGARSDLVEPGAVDPLFGEDGRTGGEQALSDLGARDALGGEASSLIGWCSDLCWWSSGRASWRRPAAPRV